MVLTIKKRIIRTEAPTPYLFNIPSEFVERFRKQLTVIDLINEGSPEVIRRAVWSCYQEKPTPFGKYELYDPGAFPAEPLSGKITWRVTQPSLEPKSDEECKQMQKIKSLMESIKKTAAKQHPTAYPDDKEKSKC